MRSFGGEFMLAYSLETTHCLKQPTFVIYINRPFSWLKWCYLKTELHKAHLLQNHTRSCCNLHRLYTFAKASLKSVVKLSRAKSSFSSKNTSMRLFELSLGIRKLSFSLQHLTGWLADIKSLLTYRSNIHWYINWIRPIIFAERGVSFSGVQKNQGKIES